MQTDAGDQRPGRNRDRADRLGRQRGDQMAEIVEPLADPVDPLQSAQHRGAGWGGKFAMCKGMLELGGKLREIAKLGAEQRRDTVERQRRARCRRIRGRGGRDTRRRRLGSGHRRTLTGPAPAQGAGSW